MADANWSKHMADVLRRNGIRLFATVPDYIVTQVLEQLWSDSQCRVVTVCREEEGLGLLSGAFMAGRRGALIMQNSGLGNCVNTLGSLNVASQIPVVLVMSHRGDLGEFNPAQVPVGQAAARILDALDIRHLMPRSIADLEAQADGLIKLAYTRSLPVAFILPAELTGGKLG
ncbi:MAG: decarboxylase [Candidatus Rokubacteria bacterium]|nr:decarboxylase [Candidatus Rokubacteria bacterium]